MDSPVFLAIDQSTSGTKALAFSSEGRPLRRVTLDHEQFYPEPGHVEHDPLEILERTRTAVAQVLSEEMEGRRIPFISITNQRETILAWDERTGKPVCRALVWQDQRGAGLCERLASEGAADLVRERTGLILDPFFSASKLAWIVAECPEARRLLAEGRLLAGTMDSWLIWNLTGGKIFATDCSNASRTMLYDIRKLRWDEDLLDLFGLRGIRLPEVRASDASYGYAELPGGMKLPIIGVAGDSHAALFGHRAWNGGEAKATYGTGSSLMANLGSKPTPPGKGIVMSLGWGAGNAHVYVLEGNIHHAGDVIRWIKDNLGLFSTYQESESMAESLPDNEGVFLVPAFSGLGAPYWVKGINATLTGMRRNSDKRHIVRAGYESIAYQVCDLVRAMDSCAPAPIRELRVDGGPTKSAFLMQFQADMLRLPILVSEVEELSALGAVYLGGLASGAWASREALDGEAPRHKRFEPRMAEKDRDRAIGGWRDALALATSGKAGL